MFKSNFEPAQLALLVCPQTGASLKYSEQTHELISIGARLAYPIEDDIPILLVSQARALTEFEIAEQKSRHSPNLG